MPETATATSDATVVVLNTTLAHHGAFSFAYQDPSNADLYGRAPIVQRVEPIADSTEQTKVIAAHLSHRMLAGVPYVITGDVSNVVTPPPVNALGSSDLVDIGLPIFDAQGQHGDWEITGSGSRKHITGTQIIASKSVWHVVLTSSGELYWQPQFGRPFNLKDPRPRQLAGLEAKMRAEIIALPLVASADVSISYEGAGVFMAVSFVTVEGQTVRERRVIRVA